MLKITKNQGSIQVTASESGFYPFDGTVTFPTNSLFTATSANTDMITFKSTSNGDVQFVGNYKDITISGRSYDTKQKFLTAFSNLANQGSVDAYTKAETDAKIDAKQGKLKAGNGITLTEDATDGTTVVKTAVSLTDNGDGAYEVGDSIGIGGRASVRIGNNNNVLQGQNSIVIGDHAMTSSEKCIAIGNSSVVNAGSTCSIVIGDSASAYSKNSVAIGYSSNATNDNPLVINAGYKTVDGNEQPLTVLQSDTTGKLSILKGDGTDERMVIQDEIEALKNAGGSGGTVDAYTKAETDNLLNAKQNTLTAGTGITIDENNVISSTGGSGGSVEGLVIDAKKVTAGLEQVSNTNYSGLTVIGNKTIAYSSKSVVIGQEAQGLGTSSTAIGYGAKGKSVETIAVGYMATADGYSSIAIGDSSKNVGNYNVVIGPKAESTSDRAAGSVAIGWLAKSSAHNGISIGYRAETNDTTPLVIKAGKDSHYNPLTVLQSDSTGKLSILKGDDSDERIVISDEFAALKAEITTLKAEIAALKGGASTGA